MADQLQLRGGTTAEHATFTGALREVTVDTDKDTVVVHDNATAGGHPLAKENLSNVSAATAATKLDGQTVKFGLGAAATPSVTFNGDLNTGVYSPGADQVAISTGGSGRLFVDASGRVGVATASPSSYNSAADNLVVADSGNGGITIATGAANYGSIYFADGTTGADQYRGVVEYNHSNNAMALYTDGGERLRITSAGLVGIGTSSPGGLLEVKSADQNPNIFRLYNAYNAGSSSWGVDFYRDTDSGNNLSVAEIKAVRTGGNASELKFGTSSTPGTVVERLRITSAGNVGIGTTTVNRPLVVFNDSVAALSLNNTTTGTAGGDGFQIQLVGSDGYVFNYEAAPVIFGTAATERARIDSSGRLLVGTSSAGDTSTAIFQGNSFSSTGGSIIRAALGSASPGSTAVLGEVAFSDNTHKTAATIKGLRDGGSWSASSLPSALTFSVTADGASSPTERMRIQSDGVARFTTDGSYTGVDTNSHAVRTAITGTWVIDTFHAGASANGIHVEYGTTPNGANNHFFYADDATAKRFTVRSNGGIENYQANDANLCDEREKKNIEDLDSTWDCLKHWELKKFHYNEDSDTEDKKYGIIAQQIASHCPEVITDWVKQKAKDAVLDEDGNVVTPAKEEIVRMGVKEQQMYWMAIKALQEAQVRIEALEAEVAALKAQ